jgi:AraC-like DNA-binding protein
MTAELLECAFSAWSQRGIPLRCELLRHRLAALLMEVVAALDEHQDGVHERPDFAAARIREVMDWLRVDPRRGKRVADLVARARLSEARFFREFKAVAGVTPKEFVLRLKVEEAAMMLMRDPACPVTTIAHDLGFSSSQHFATVFREYLLVSPSDYRARCKRVQ